MMPPYQPKNPERYTQDLKRLEAKRLLWTIPEVAAMWSMSKRMVKELIRHQKLPAARLSNLTVRISSQAIAQFVDTYTSCDESVMVYPRSASKRAPKVLS